jgi:hypothetical protein
MLCQIVSYCLITINFRAVAQANIPISLFTDGLNSSLVYFVIRKIAKEDNTAQFVGWLGYLTGSLIGTYLGIILSVKWAGQ